MRTCSADTGLNPFLPSPPSSFPPPPSALFPGSPSSLVSPHSPVPHAHLHCSIPNNNSSPSLRLPLPDRQAGGSQPATTLLAHHAAQRLAFLAPCPPLLCCLTSFSLPLLPSHSVGASEGPSDIRLYIFLSKTSIFPSLVFFFYNMKAWDVVPSCPWSP